MPLSVDRVLRKARQLASKGETNLAAQEYNRVLAKFPKNQQAIEGLKALRLAAAKLPRQQRDGLTALYKQGRLQQTLAAGEALARQFPDDAFLANLLGAVNFELRQPEQAVTHFRRALELDPQFILAHINQGDALTALGAYEGAVASYSKALQLGHSSAEVHNALGNALNVLGRTGEAAASYGKALQLRPDYAEAHRNLSVIKTYRAADAQIQQMLELRDSRGILDQDRMLLNFALGKAFDDTGNYDDAFACFSSGNRLRSKALVYDRAAVAASVANTKAAFSGDLPSLDKAGAAAQAQDRRPIFVLGMPRSGTSLVEQILASHSQVFGAGELGLLGESINAMQWTSAQITPNHLQAIRDSYLSGLAKLGAREAVITDKMPFNFLWLGFIVLALPEAKIVHVVRDGRATCWSNFENSFTGAGTEFAYDLEDLAHYYLMYADLMAFWHAKFPGRIYDLQYEALTQSQEAESRKLLQFAGLDWEQQCMEFHTTQRAVRTASAAQVRQKMYRGSSDKWRRYEKHLAAMLKMLGH